MGDAALEVGSLVWAKMKGYSPWPGLVAKPPPGKQKPKPGRKRVYFFGTKNFAWIEEQHIKDYETHKEICEKACKSQPFKEALVAIEEFKVGRANGQLQPDGYFEEEVPQGEEEQAEDADASASGSSDVKPAGKPRGRKKRVVEENGDSTTPKGTPGVKKRRSSVVDKKPKLSVAPAPIAAGGNHIPRKRAGINFIDRPVVAARVESAPLNVKEVTEALKDKNITPADIKIGFLGLGIMGSGMVKNLLNSGHKVIIWNRSTDKCKDFIAAGAEQGMTPSDVIQTADITFSCVSDPQAAKDMVFGNCGVLQEMTAAKGYVEMTGIDSETSSDIAEAIGSKGGRYLEAQLQGSKTEAEQGMLVIISAGERSLFDDCQTAFHAIGKSSFFLGGVGQASRMNLVLQLIYGVTLSGLAEGMALADRAGIQQKDVLEILGLTALNSKFMVDKGNAIIDGNFPTHQPLQHLQKDLNLALGMGHQLDQPLPLAASANEVFKHGKRLGYAEHDVAAVYIRARF